MFGWSKERQFFVKKIINQSLSKRSYATKIYSL